VLTLEAARANGDIVTARKATRWFRIDARGKAAHAGVEPEKGASATLALAHIIVESFKLNRRKPGMTLNPGRITGGANPNIVAEEASVLVDIRAWTNTELEELASALQGLVDTEWVPGVKQTMALNGGSGMPAMERTPGTQRLEDLAIGIARELGFPLKGASTGGGSDVSIAVHAGAAGLDGLGPIGGLDHSPDEYIEVSSIVPRTALLARLLQAICADDTLVRR
jgi:glutamate carboxypeptidase